MQKLRINNKLREYGIEIILPPNQYFDSAVKEYFGEDAELLIYLERLKPLTLFVKNTSSAHISAISINWDLPQRGDKRVHPQTEINLGFIHSRNPVPPEKVKSYSVIPSQGVKFYSYVQIPFDLMRKSNVFKNSNGIGGAYFSMSGQEEFLKKLSEFVFSVDAVLFSDGRFVGEDRGFLFERLNASLKAERDFAKKVKELKDKGVSDGEIILKAQAKSEKGNHPVVRPQTAREAFDSSYAQTVNSLRETILHQKTVFQLSDEKILNMTMKGLETSNFKIYRADI